MELYYEESNESKKKSKSPIIIGIIIILLVILTILVIWTISYIQNSVFKVKINGESNSDFRELIQMEQTADGTKMYFPIKSVASFLGYTGYTGDFKSKSEDSSKCYIDNGEEMAMFTANSDSLIISTDGTTYEEYTLEENVIERNGQLYTTSDGLIKAFHVTYNYNSETNSLDIYTTDYLTSTYAKNLKIDPIPKLFRDRQAILEGLIIVETGSQKKYGVLNVSTQKYVLETKYDSISYIPYSTDFLVQSNGKYGIMTKEGRTKISIAYDEITLMDNKNGLYLVKEDNLFGVINNEGKSILSPNYEQIGVDGETFAQNALDNQYILIDTLIPVKYNGYWGFFNTEGVQITDFEYTNVGCTTSSLTNTYPVVEIPSIKLVVVEKDKMYNLMDAKGTLRINGFVLNSVYLTYDATSGKNSYFMTYGGNTNNIEERFRTSLSNS